MTCPRAKPLDPPHVAQPPHYATQEGSPLRLSRYIRSASESVEGRPDSHFRNSACPRERVGDRRRSGRHTEPGRREELALRRADRWWPRLRGQQLPAPLGDDFDGAVADLDGGL